MRLVTFEGRFGTYMLDADKVAWLRSDENGQTKVGLVAGEPFHVRGELEDVARRLIEGD